MNLIPSSDRVLVRMIEGEKVSAGGIVIPEVAQTHRGKEGRVMAVGPGRRADDGAGERIPMDYDVGDRVLLGMYSGSEIKDADGQILVVVRQDEIIGKIVGED